MPVASVHYDDHPNDIAMRNHAYQQGAAVYDAVGATRTVPDAALPRHPQHGDKPDEREGPRWTTSTNMGRHTTSRTCSSRMAASSRPVPRVNPDADHSHAAILLADYIGGAMQRGEI